MTIELRNTGISAVGNVRWGTHFCLFYQTKQDLLDILIPYFKTGLDNNEFCLWITLNEAEARDALRHALPAADRPLAAGDIEIVRYSQWYLRDGAFDLESAIDKWKEKLAQALEKGYAGMRVHANEAWLTEEYRTHFSAYEEAASEFIANQPMIAICTYPLAVVRGDEIFDVARTHQFAIAKRQGRWEVIETPELRQAKAEIQRLNEELEQRVAERTSELAAANKELRREIREHKQAEEEVRQHAARMEALAEISQALAVVGLDLQIVLDTIVEYTAEVIGDACVIALVLGDEQRLQPVAFHHPDPEIKTFMSQMLIFAPRYTENELFTHILQTGQPALIPSVPQEQLRQITAPQHWPYLERAGIHSLLVVALRVQGQIIGTLGVTRDAPGRPYTPHDQAFLLDLADRAALTLQNARLFQQIHGAHERLRTLSRRLLEVQETERRTIARELHDEIGQRLTGLALLLGGENPSPDQLIEAQALVRDLIARLRNLSLDLRPSILDDLGLIPALVWLFERYTMQTKVSVRFEHRLLEQQRFEIEVETTAYRIVQEALTNVARHAGVSEVTVRLWTDDATFWVVVADQGRGFDSQMIDRGTSSGIAGMQERAALLGGTFTIEAVPGGGTRLTASLPLHSSAGSSEQEQGS